MLSFKPLSNLFSPGRLRSGRVSPKGLFSLLNCPSLRQWGLIALVAAAVFGLTRLALLAHLTLIGHQPLGDLLGAMARGLAPDLLLAAFLASPFAVLEMMLPKKWCDRLRWPLLFPYVFLLLFVAVAEIVFWDEFGARFNFIAVDYLVFTTELIGNIRESYPVGKIIAALLLVTLLSGLALRRPMLLVSSGGQSFAKRQWLLVLPLLLAIGLGAYRLKPPEFSSNAYANELADNGWRSFLWAARQNKLDYRRFYATRPDAEVSDDLHALTGNRTLSATASPFIKVSHPIRRQPNIIVVMMESMSSEYMATFGNKDNLTPNLDRLASESLLFSRLYATGTRTVRGLEALSVALPPLPGKSVVRWDGVSNLNTLGGTLAARGWTPHFVYGGYGVFDNMNGFFSAQGYRITDRTGFREGLVQFENIWGVADEHLFDQVLINADQDAAAGKPFFMHVMTASNHVPFTYPAGRIDIPSPGGRHGGIKYADYAIGRFIEMAKKKPWFENTLFLFVADHCARSAGKAKIPVYRYHIPALVYAPKLIKPRRIDQLASQIDLAPTLLGILGLQEDSRFIGRDILRTPEAEGRALLSTYQNLGYLKGDILTVLQPRRKIESYRIDADGQEAAPIALDQKMANEAIAYFQGAALLMERHGKDGISPQRAY